MIDDGVRAVDHGTADVSLWCNSVQRTIQVDAIGPYWHCTDLVAALRRVGFPSRSSSPPQDCLRAHPVRSPKGPLAHASAAIGNVAPRRCGDAQPASWDASTCRRGSGSDHWPEPCAHTTYYVASGRRTSHARASALRSAELGATAPPRHDWADARRR